MPYNPNIHHRKSIRLKGYDYSQAGLYFLTICCQNRKCLFGKVINQKMELNDAGKIADECWLEIPQHFPRVVLHEYVIMPNHVHGIIELVGINNHSSESTGAKNLSPLQSPSGTIGSIVRGYKIGVTIWMRKNTDVHNVWQRNYHERIIHNERSFQIISKYIMNNPAKWSLDKFHIKKIQRK